MSAVRIQFWLFVVTPTGSNNLLAVEEGQVYLNRVSRPGWPQLLHWPLYQTRIYLCFYSHQCIWSLQLKKRLVFAIELNNYFRLKFGVTSNPWLFIGTVHNSKEFTKCCFNLQITRGPQARSEIIASILVFFYFSLC